MFEKSRIDKLATIPTPFYYYDMKLLKETLEVAKKEAEKYQYHVHYAIKANSNPRILKEFQQYGFGADCVSGNEVKRSLECGFEPHKVVFAGVGKTAKEIEYALNENILCFNCESIPEIELINELAAKQGKKAAIAIRVNPNVNAKTHHYITTGLEENKFGINAWEFEKTLQIIQNAAHLELIGLHVHIGSQITDLSVFQGLCIRVNEIIKWFRDHRQEFKIINMGGGLGVNYTNPDEELILDFQNFFSLFDEHLHLAPTQELHFELGRSLVAQSGTLFSKVQYIKEGIKTHFAILDAGMTELMRPALYQAYHKIENLSSEGAMQTYDVVGPICESSDSFGKKVKMNKTSRNDLIAIRTTGAYGEVMASQYNLRDLPKAIYSDELENA